MGIGQALYTDTEQQILDFCDKYERIVEVRFVVSKVNSIAKDLRKDLKQHFRTRQEITMQKVRAAWGRFMESDVTDFSDYAFDLDEEAALLETLFTPYYVESGQFGAELSTEHLARILRRQILYRGTRSWILDNAIRFGKRYARLVSRTTNAAIRDQIADALKLGEGLDSLMVRIQDVYRAVTTYRSEMIARTEMGRSFNMSRLIQDHRLGLELYDWIGCASDCPICGPFMAANPHTWQEIEDFVMRETHPNCVGTEVARVPEGFEPNLQ